MSDIDAVSRKKWDRWLRTDPHNALQPRVLTMLVDDLEFRILVDAANSHKDCALNSPIIMRNLIRGYAANQGLAIRCLLYENGAAFSLPGLLKDIKRKMPSDKRIETIEKWLEDPVIKRIINWSHVFLAHAGDSEQAGNKRKGVFSELAPTLKDIEDAHRHIVRTVDAISVCVLGNARQLDVVPSYGGYDPLSDLVKLTGDFQAPSKARQLWLKLRDERQQWVSGIAEELSASRA